MGCTKEAKLMKVFNKKGNFFFGMTKGDIAFEMINAIILAIIAFSTLYPFWYVLVKSILPFEQAIKTKFYLIPTGFTLESYKFIFSTDRMVRSINISVILTVFGTIYQLFFTALTGYGLSKKNLPGRNFMFSLIIVTMFFGGGLIPTYLLIRGLGLMNTLWALILPGTIGTYNMIIMKTFFQSLPEEIEESARMDGAGYLKIFFRIIIPLSKPVISTIGLFISVGLWNSWYGPLLYLNDKNLWPMALLLREILIKTDVETLASTYVSEDYMLSDSIKMATVIVSVTPIVIVYPFLQKYFVKGVMIGAIKS